MAISFDLSPVATERAPLPTAAALEVLRRRGFVGLEAASPAPPYVQGQAIHGLLLAAHLAFSRHYPLRLSPDHIWVCIAQGLARHINEHAEALRPRLVRHQGRIELEVRRDEFIPGDPQNDWPGVFSEFSAILRGHLGGRRDLFVADFSTTDLTARAASELVLLGAVEQYFSYSVATLCGIPRLTLEGTPEDWAKLRRRVEALGEFDLGWWVAALRPVVARLEQTARGQIDLDFWQRFYKPLHASGGEAISGWINALFPYLGDQGATRNNAMLAWMAADPARQEDLDEWSAANPGARPPRGAEEDDPSEDDDGDDYPRDLNELELPKLSRFPSGITQAPFEWRFPADSREMSFLAGFFGATQGPDGTLQPQLGWAVGPRVKERRIFRIARIEEPLGGSARPYLSPRSDGLISLAGLAEEAAGLEPFELNLGWCRQLTSLEGLEGLDNLEVLSLLECTRLETLAPLAGLRGLRRLSVSQCAAVRDIGAVATLPALSSLSVMHCPQLGDLRPLAGLRGLTALYLWGGLIPKELQGAHTTPAAIERVLRALA